MKQTTFKCEITDEALDAYDEHVNANPNGMSLYNGKSRASKSYFGMYTIRETKMMIIVEKVK